MFVRLILFIIVLCILSVSNSFSYFEDRYWCVIQSDAIEISLTTGEKKCMDYLAGLSTLLLETTTDRKTAIENEKITEGYDRDYRTKQKKELEERKNILSSTQKDLLIAIDDFEKELFVRIKSVVGYYLFSYTAEIEQKRQQGEKVLARLVILGNADQYLIVRRQMDIWNRELVILHRIQQASDFADLIPPLKRWLGVQPKQ